MTVWRRVTIMVAAGLALAGCGTATGSGTGAVPPATSSATGIVTVAAEPDNGRTITLAVGDRLTVRLSSTYWKFAPPSGPALTVVGTATTPDNSRTHCMPGQGCGAATADYTAAAPGTSVVTANRTSCGEAMACHGSAGAYRLTVTVR